MDYLKLLTDMAHALDIPVLDFDEYTIWVQHEGRYLEISITDRTEET